MALTPVHVFSTWQPAAPTTPSQPFCTSHTPPFHLVAWHTARVEHAGLAMATHILHAGLAKSAHGLDTCACVLHVEARGARGALAALAALLALLALLHFARAHPSSKPQRPGVPPTPPPPFAQQPPSPPFKPQILPKKT